MDGNGDRAHGALVGGRVHRLARTHRHRGRRRPYVVRVQTTDEGEIAFAVHSGFFQVGKGLEPDTTLATVLASVAERTTEIDVPRAQAAKEAAEARLASATKGEDESEELLAYAAFERAELRLSAASK